MPDVTWIANNGLAVGIVAFLLFGAYRACRKGGPVDRLIIGHLDFVTTCKDVQKENSMLLKAHCIEEEAEIARFVRVGRTAAEVAREAGEKIGLSEESQRKLAAIEAEFRTVQQK